MQYLLINGDLSQVFSPHAKFGAITTCDHKTEGNFNVMIHAEAVVPNRAALREIDGLIKES